jgi:uracil phosphoribosyltransferase
MYLLSKHPSIANTYVAELRDINIQKDRLRFRKNLERIGEVFAYEISKKLEYEMREVETPLGIAQSRFLKDRVILSSILRAGLPLHQGLLNVFDKADNAFVSAYRMHHKDGTFEINLEYTSCPNLNDAVLILADPMLATGSSIDVTIRQLLEFGTPKKIHVVAAIASVYGYEYIKRLHPDVSLWIGDLDEELTAKSYIVPGLGDAGDLAYGTKLQE